MSKVHIHWGASHQARAVVSQLFAATETPIVFIDQESDLLRVLQGHEKYTVEVQALDNKERYITPIAGVLKNEDQKAISEYICEADFITIAAHEVAMPKIITPLAYSLQERRAKRGDAPLAILLIDGTQDDAAGFLQLLESHLEGDFPLKEVLGITASYTNPFTAQLSSEKGIDLVTTPVTDLYVENQTGTRTIPSFTQLRRVKTLHDWQLKRKRKLVAHS